MAVLEETRSRFRSGRAAGTEKGGDLIPHIEGLMLRREDYPSTSDLTRMKLVRAEFQQGITEFWTKKGAVKNEIDFGWLAEYLAECYLSWMGHGEREELKASRDVEERHRGRERGQSSPRGHL